MCVCVSLFPPHIFWISSLMPGRLGSHHVSLSPQEIKVILDLLDKGSLSSPWPKTVTELPLQGDATLKCFYLPSLEKQPLPFLSEISSLFGWCLSVWQLFSSAWCSILLEGGRWFRRFTVTLTDPNHLLPSASFFFSFFSQYTHDCTFHISMDDVNMQQHATHVESSWHFLKVCVIADYLHKGESLLACCRNACDL